MKREELIEEAKKRYPIGSRVVCLCDTLEYYVGDFDHDGSDTEDVWCNSTDGWGIKLRDNGVWTNIVGSEKKEKTQDDVIKEAVAIIETLLSYGRIRPIEGVKYPLGSHTHVLNLADDWLWENRKQ